MKLFPIPKVLLVFIPLIFAGCGVGSIYGPGSYSETKVGEDVRRITFRGGDHPMTGDLCLLRCSEVTLESGYSYFQVVDSESGSSIDQIPSAYPFHRHYHMEDSFFHEPQTLTEGKKTTVVRKCYRKNKKSLGSSSSSTNSIKN